MSLGDWVNVGVGVVLLLTLGAVLWYAWETRKLAKEAQRARFDSLRPIVRIGDQRFEHPSSVMGRRLFSVTNEGVGPALQLSIAAMIGGKRMRRSGTTFLSMRQMPSPYPEGQVQQTWQYEAQGLLPEDSEEEKAGTGSLLALASPSPDLKDNFIVCEYQDVYQRWFETWVELRPDGDRVIVHKTWTPGSRRGNGEQA